MSLSAQRHQAQAADAAGREQLGVYTIRLQERCGLPETICRLSPNGYFLQPMLSQDGRDVVFWGREAGETGFNIWRAGAGDGPPERLTDTEAVSGHPFWSVDGRHIVYFSTCGVSSETEWEMGNQFRLDRAPRNIWIMGSDGGGQRRLTYGPHVDERPCISPDGRHVVFVSNRSGAMTLWSVSTATEALLQLPLRTGLAYRPIFSPSGDRLAFFSSRSPGGNHELCIMDWPDGEPTFPIPADTFRWVHGPFWLAGGQALLLHAVAAGEEECALWGLHLRDQRIERIELPGIRSYAHGSLDTSGTVLAFDSRQDLCR